MLQRIKHFRDESSNPPPPLFYLKKIFYLCVCHARRDEKNGFLDAGVCHETPCKKNRQLWGFVLDFFLIKLFRRLLLFFCYLNRRCFLRSPSGLMQVCSDQICWGEFFFLWRPALPFLPERCGIWKEEDPNWWSTKTNCRPATNFLLKKKIFLWN